MRISLCMIVRDEEANLDACLASARECVDEMIIVDTGSRDRTAAIASSWGAQVFHHPWRDDYADARNRSLEPATGDFILQLDADERLAPGSADVIRQAVAGPDAGGFYFTVVSDMGSYRTQATLLRLFRRLPSVRYEGRVHEQVAPSLAAQCRSQGLTLSHLPVRLEHSGYHPTVMQARGKTEQRLRQLRAQLLDHPDDIYSRFKLAELLNASQQKPLALEQALEATQRVRRLGAKAQDIPCIDELPALLGLLFHELGETKKAYQLLTAEQSQSRSPNLHFVLAMTAQALGDLETAFSGYHRCLELANVETLSTVREGLTGYLAKTGLGLVTASKGLYADASRWLEAALDENPGCQEAIAAYVQLVQVRGESREEAARRVEAYATARVARDPEAPRRASSWLLTLGFPDRARALTMSPSPVATR